MHLFPLSLLSTLFLLITLVLASANPQTYMVLYPRNTPATLITSVKELIIKGGGKIIYDYS